MNNDKLVNLVKDIKRRNPTQKCIPNAEDSSYMLRKTNSLLKSQCLNVNINCSFLVLLNGKNLKTVIKKFSVMSKSFTF